MKKITFLTLLLTFSIANGFSQEILVNDFESAASADFPVASTIVAEVVANPFPDANNTSDTCLKVSSSDGAHLWWGLVRFPIEPAIAINQFELKYLSVMVNYPAPADFVVRFNGTDKDPNGTNAGTVRALNDYDGSAPNTWQEIVFQIKDGDRPGQTNFTLGTLDRIVFHPDGLDNGKGRVLVVGASGYIDNVRILDKNPLATASVNDASLKDAFSIYPSAVSSTFTVKTTKTISDISVFSILGKNVSNNIVKLGNETYDASSLASGMYIVKIASENGNFITKKIIKE